MTERIPFEECEVGFRYRVTARNFEYGVCVRYGEKEEWVGFVGIRERFGDYFLDMESASAVPLERLVRCPLEDLSEGRFLDDRWCENKPLFDWLLDRTPAGERATTTCRQRRTRTRWTCEPADYVELNTA